jgi:hypothetical protein
MNGIIYKATILSIVFSSLTFLGSLTYAANNGDIKNQSTKLTAEAGCMGCHQGETIAVNESMSKSSDHQVQQDQKPKDTPEASKHIVPV